MTATIARQPLQTLSMSSSQRGPRRLSARLRDKEEAQPPTTGYHLASSTQPSGSVKHSGQARGAQDRPPATKKRRIDYDEEDDGFMFKRANSRKTRTSVPKSTPISEQLPPEKEKEDSRPPVAVNVPPKPREEPMVNGPPKKRSNRMSFSTPNLKAEKPVRRSKRLSDEAERRDGSPHGNEPKKNPAPLTHLNTPRERDASPEKDIKNANAADMCEEHSETKIALPFADTPVIRKNKAMRGGKSSKRQRRSSLGLRGRRASSLIESGTSSALPHSEVEIADYYKHIESEGLSEPRRMRQLLTWCATKALDVQHDAPAHSASSDDDHSVRLAARVIKEELLKDFANRSDMSDWFSREDVQKAEKPLPTRPNPKNLQNAAKIEELQEQIKRLGSERQSLEALLRPPSIPAVTPSEPPQQSPSHAHPLHPIDTSLLLPSDAAILQRIQDDVDVISPSAISSRVNRVTASLGPTIDAFADGVHKMARYRDTAERVAGRVLAVCAEKLEKRDQEDRRRAVSGEGQAARGDQQGDGEHDLTDVLRSLSRIER